MFMVLKLAGILRVSEEDERVGADVSKHGGEAYPEMVAKAKAADAPKSATVQLGLTDQKPKTEGAIGVCGPAGRPMCGAAATSRPRRCSREPSSR